MRADPAYSALAAIVIAAAAILLTALSVASPTPPAPPAPAAATVDISLIITGVGAVGAAEHHFFNPSMITVRRGDTVRLRVMNLTFSTHGVEIEGYGVRTGPLPGGPKGQETITFVADRAGVFRYRCNVPYNPATGDCSPDHETQVGYLVVLDHPR
jgi:plastocyanin